MLDSIFGKKNYIHDITWQRKTASAMTRNPRHYVSTSDTLLHYSKSGDYVFHPFLCYSEEDRELKGYTLFEQASGRYYRWTSPYMSKNMGARPNLCYEWRGFKERSPSGWFTTKDKLEQYYCEGRVVIIDGKVRAKAYFDEATGTFLVLYGQIFL